MHFPRTLRLFALLAEVQVEGVAGGKPGRGTLGKEFGIGHKIS